MAKVFLGLGSNIGNREASIDEAVLRLGSNERIRIIDSTDNAETEPVDYLEQPMFINRIVVVETEYPPEDLLKVIKKIESDMGRVRTLPKGPRNIDIDIILYDDIIHKSEILEIPHPAMRERAFILDQLAVIDESITDPVTGLTVRELINELDKKH